MAGNVQVAATGLAEWWGSGPFAAVDPGVFAAVVGAMLALVSIGSAIALFGDGRLRRQIAELVSVAQAAEATSPPAAVIQQDPWRDSRKEPGPL